MTDLVAHSVTSLSVLAAPDHPATERSPMLYLLYVLSALGVILLVYVIVQAMRKNNRS
ncbi:hypothetical protein ABZ379_42210 [Streptomyces canus]|uniref:hypothetical protein n=1 Tax=Streptomyces canus TaxID=58343 RepID=UPI0033DE193F